MIQVKQNLNKKEKEVVWSLLQDLPDIYKDFYITKNNLRLFIRENLDLLYDCLKKGDRIAFDENLGMILIYGFSDKSPRKYVKILTKDDESASHLLKILAWNIKEDLYAKVKKTNPLKRTLERNGFRFSADRGKEILLKRTYIPTRPIRQKKEYEEKL